jgi:hypothetical protein
MFYKIGARSLADLIDNMGAPFQGNSMLSNLMPEGKYIILLVK